MRFTTSNRTAISVAVAFVVAGVACGADRSREAPPGTPTPADTSPNVAFVTETARAVALRYNRALNGGNCEAARDLGGKTMGPDSSFAQWCEPTDYSPGARGIRLNIKSVDVRGADAVVSFTQRMCLVGAQTGDPQTRIYSGRWTVDVEAGVIISEERRETGAQFDCEPPLIGGGS